MSEQEDTPQKSETGAMDQRGTGNELGSSSAIGRRLKAYYDDVASEPVPDKFLSLLEALDAASDNASGRNRQ